MFSVCIKYERSALRFSEQCRVMLFDGSALVLHRDVFMFHFSSPEVAKVKFEFYLFLCVQ
ncbi:hypothetical protein GCK32_021296 [Trichostrongylus colubriformis]|uniref:Uncharacterized protein n=1 Tax=Trichostrongylus colubriformis TaxID=6319 RepID=A0AAN8FGL8_TRICO